MAEKSLDQELTQTEQRQSRLKDLIARGKEQGYLTYAEVNDHLPEEIADPDQVEDIIRMIGDMGISVGEEAPDDDQLLLGENSKMPQTTQPRKRPRLHLHPWKTMLEEQLILFACTCGKWAPSNYLRAKAK